MNHTELHYACIYLNQDRDLHASKRWKIDIGKLRAALDFGIKTAAQAAPAPGAFTPSDDNPFDPRVTRGPGLG